MPTPIPTSVEIVNKKAVLLHIPEEHGLAVRVILGQGDGPLVYVDANGQIHVNPHIGDPVLRDAFNGILQNVQTVAKLAGQAGAQAAH
jgi:hypothetical protein